MRWYVIVGGVQATTETVCLRSTNNNDDDDDDDGGRRNDTCIHQSFQIVWRVHPIKIGSYC